MAVVGRDDSPGSSIPTLMLSDDLGTVLSQDALSAVFQPIVSLGRQSILGYEGLIRCPGNPALATPSALFDLAERQGRLIELDARCREVVIREFARLRVPGQLFLNVHPAALSGDGQITEQTVSSLKRHRIDPDRIVIEITEVHPVRDFQLFQEALAYFRKRDFKVALDDLGAGYSGLKIWSESNPDFVKVDRHFVQDVDADRTKQRFLSAILEIAKAMGCQVITEGVENKREYAMVRKLGVAVAQGYYFGRPENPPAQAVAAHLFSERSERSGTLHHQRLTASSLVHARPTIEPTAKIDKLIHLFNADNHLRSVAVVESGDPLGLVVRDDFMSLMASRFGRDLNHRRPVRHFIQRRCLIVDCDESLEAISQRLTAALNHYAEEFIITRAGDYLGIGSLMDLLGKITELQVTRARYSNPLTLLPGNVVIQQVMEDALAASEPIVVAYLDIDHFKAFNDAYGYGHGDEVLRLLARLLLEHAEPDRDFVGHIGGDDFIALFRSADWAARCRQVLGRFVSLVEPQYSPNDRASGGITATDRFGTVRHYPIMSLSIGALKIRGGHRELTDTRVAELATAAKSKAKKLPGNQLCLDLYPGEGSSAALGAAAEPEVVPLAGGLQ